MCFYSKRRSGFRMNKLDQIPEEKEKVSELVIRPSRSLLDLDIRATWEYRDMLRFLVIRDFVSKYKQTLLGPLWFFIQPLVTAVIFTVVFGTAAGLSTDDTPKMLFYLCGQLCWNYFASCFVSCGNSLVANAGLYRKVYFPRIILPLSTLASNIISLGIQLFSFFGFWLYFKFFSDLGGQFSISWTFVFFPLLVLQTAAISIGSGLFMAAMSAKYRDLQKVVPFLSQMLLFATPIIYPMSEVSPEMHWIVNLNPLAAVVEASRVMFLGVGSINSMAFVQSILITIVLLIVGVTSFNRVQRKFVDYA